VWKIFHYTDNTDYAAIADFLIYYYHCLLKSLWVHLSVKIYTICFICIFFKTVSRMASCNDGISGSFSLLSFQLIIHHPSSKIQKRYPFFCNFAAKFRSGNCLLNLKTAFRLTFFRTYVKKYQKKSILLLHRNSLLYGEQKKNILL
jgi:hypothetical protein